MTLTHHIIFKYSDRDDIAVTVDDDDECTVVFLDNTEADQYIQTNLRTLATKGVHLSPFQRELVYFASAIYSVDRRLERQTTAYNQWDRYIHIYYPVSEVARWEQVNAVIRSAVSFVAGDNWSFTFYETDFRPESEEHSLVTDYGDVDAVALLSGGLDSFIGAVDLLEAHKSGIVFVSHYTSGSMEHNFQEAVINFLRTHYANRVHHVDFFVQPYKSASQPELTSRSRSFMYFVMGVIVAQAVSSPTFVIPENGFISLNVPLTANRMGSLSSRTTHPHFVELFQRFIHALGIDIAVTAPYKFKTKGEMLVEARNSDVVRNGYALTMSCSTASGHRFQSHSPKTHCGKCIPCVVRRAALCKAGLDQDDYITDVLSVSNIDSTLYPDLWALHLAILKYKSKPPTMFDVLGSGVLSQNIGDYVDVYTRGFDELIAFLEQS